MMYDSATAVLRLLFSSCANSNKSIYVCSFIGFTCQMESHDAGRSLVIVGVLLPLQEYDSVIKAVSILLTDSTAV